MFTHSNREKHGIRWWWHLSSGTRPRVIAIEFYWWSFRFGATVGTDDDGWNLSLRVPPFALYLSLDGLGLWQPQEKHIFTWDNNREVWLPARRECDFHIHDWTIRFTPWGCWGEWRTADPWWVSGVSLDLARLVLGQRVYVASDVALVPCSVAMPEGSYPAVATVRSVTRGYQRWFKRTRNETTLDIPNGIPFAGKGENSWDCDDDGLFGIGGSSIGDAISRAQASVSESRKRHGHASLATVRRALESATAVNAIDPVGGRDHGLTPRD